ncbi:MAG: hypothetical protein JWQ01_809 [Massilia sp.]|nr:hypothetical protein [Massilia sp.]
MKFILLVASLTWATVCGAASFDCSKASTRIEHMICADSGLSAEDEKLNVAFRDALAATHDPEQMRQQQRKWIAETRNRCSDRKCLSAAHEARMTELARPHGESPAPETNTHALANADAAASGKAAAPQNSAAVPASAASSLSAETAYKRALSIVKDRNGRFVVAADLLKNATVNGSSDAPLLLGQMYLQGWRRNSIVNGVEDFQKPDPEKGIKLILLAENRDNLDAMLLHAELLRHGTHMPKDKMRAIELYEVAARRQSNEAILQLSVIADDRDKKAPWYDITPGELNAASAALTRLHIDKSQQTKLVTDADTRKRQHNQEAEDKKRELQIINNRVRMQSILERR